MRYILDISYLGTRYAGWQIQPNANTVQAELNRALSILLQKEIETLGAGRTDTGVHAAQLLVHVDIEGDLPLHFQRRLNSLLPKDIAVHAIFTSSKTDFHARFDAIRRQYQYFITAQKHPLLAETAWFCPAKLDVEKMNEAATILLEYDDFASFAKTGGQNHTTFCKLSQAHWRKAGEKEALFVVKNAPLYVFTIESDRFLRGMVRAIVGTLVRVGEGKISLPEFRRVIEAKNRRQAAENAPPQGLFLTKVEYPEGFLLFHAGL